MPSSLAASAADVPPVLSPTINTSEVSTQVCGWNQHQGRVGGRSVSANFLDIEHAQALLGFQPCVWSQRARENERERS